MTEIYGVISVLSQEAFDVTQVCEVLEVSRSAFYDWKNARPNRYQQQDEDLGPLIQDIFHRHRRRYGARRIACELQQQGVSCSRNKVRKIMEKMSLVAIQPKSFKPRTTESKHTLGYNENLLLEGFEVREANQIWVGDITYVGLKNRFAYLSMLMDLFSRRIVGWSLDIHMNAALVVRSLKNAIMIRQPEPGLIHHTDRGGQYAAKEYRNLLSRVKMKQSMSRAGDCYDNAFMESCFGTVKTELEMKTYQNLRGAFHEIQDYINYYNSIRRHSSLGYMSPNHFEMTRNP